MIEQRQGRQPSKAICGDLPDVNVWLALAVNQHPHHDAAVAYWNGHEAGPVWFCRVTMLGLVRLLSNPKVMGEQALHMEQSLATYQRFVALPEIGWHAEPSDCGDHLQKLVSTDLPARLLTNA